MKMESLPRTIYVDELVRYGIGIAEKIIPQQLDQHSSFPQYLRKYRYLSFVSADQMSAAEFASHFSLSSDKEAILLRFYECFPG